MQQRSDGGPFIVTRRSSGPTLNFPSKCKEKTLEHFKDGTEVI